MANCHTAFGDYLNALNLTNSQEDKLRQSRDALIDRISARFKKDGRKVPDYESQGSYALNTQNRPLSDDFDLDHGVYFVHLDDGDTLSVHDAFKLVRDSVDGHTSEPLPYKDTCVRVQYKAADDGTPAHHIDLAIYRKFSNGDRHYAHLSKGWQPSDQKGFIKHFERRATDQTRAVVRWLKGWSDFNNGEGDAKLPSGFHLTVCVLECFQADVDRHDRSFLQTVETMSERLKSYRKGTGSAFKRPVTPNEDIFASFSVTRIDHFVRKLDEVAALGRKAVNETDENRARRLWQKVFGDRFEAPAEVEESKAQPAWTAPAVIGTSGKAA
jgi:hypothetical protein